MGELTHNSHASVVAVAESESMSDAVRSYPDIRSAEASYILTLNTRLNELAALSGLYVCSDAALEADDGLNSPSAAIPSLVQSRVLL